MSGRGPRLDRRTALQLGGAAAAVALARPLAWAQGKSGLHGLSIFGDLKYGPDFAHFDYLVPDALKGGIMRFSPPDYFFNQNPQTFNTLNGFVQRGDAPPRMGLLFDTLMARANDEPDAVYGLLAESVSVTDDGNEYTFALRDGARFHDGTPVTAEDVAFSLLLLKEKGHPNISQIIRELVDAKAPDSSTVRLTLSGKQSRDLIFTLVGLPIFSKAYYSTHDFLASTMKPPLGSGPYKVGTVTAGRTITFARDPNYWAKDLPVNVGLYNFDEIRIDFYRDRQISFEALKKGDTTYREEFTSKVWATEYNFPALATGKVKQVLVPDEARPDIQAWYLNTRRRKFTDPRTRQAIGLCFDFEWTNKNIFYDSYSRGRSFFEKSDFEAKGLPSADESALLELYRDQLPETVFGESVDPPVSDGSGRDRKLLRQASQLLADAGWQSEGGVMRNDAGDTLTVEFLIQDNVFTRAISPFIANLKAIGADGTIRLVDSAQYFTRVSDFDFDCAMNRVILSATPLDGLSLFYGSDAADTPGTYNLAGIKNPVVDDLLARVPGVQSRAELITLLRAMDRVLRAYYYVVPNWIGTDHRVAHWDLFGQPAEPPAYDFSPELTWWYDPDKATAIGMAG
jgi:microcin C transport system substrate-binding protein